VILDRRGCHLRKDTPRRLRRLVPAPSLDSEPVGVDSALALPACNGRIVPVLTGKEVCRSFLYERAGRADLPEFG
jgi:hypothetical protein